MERPIHMHNNSNKHDYRSLYSEYIKMITDRGIRQNIKNIEYGNYILK